MKARRTLPLLSCLVLGVFATNADADTDTDIERARLLAPTEVGVVYSEVEAQARILLTPSLDCQYFGCVAQEAFRQRVNQLSKIVGAGAFKLALEMNLSPPNFNVTVPGKDDIGTLSTAAGNITVFDGLQQFDLQDPALAFLIAREMGHVLAQHHEENTATSITISVAVALLFPMLHVLRSAEAAYVAASTTTTTSLASSAVSFAGATILKNIYRSDQVREADIFALRILAHAGWTPFEIAEALDPAMLRLTTTYGWVSELHESKRWLDQLATGPMPLPAEMAAQAEVVAAADITPHLSLDIALAAAIPPSAELEAAAAFPPPPEPPIVGFMPAPLPVEAAFAAVPVRSSPRQLLAAAKPVEKKIARTCTQRVVRGVKKLVCTSSPPVKAKPRSAPAAKEPRQKR